MKKQEAIDAICNLKINDGWVNRYAVVSIVDQIEPQKPVIPQLVADWIEKCKSSGFSLRMAMEHWSMSEKLEKWMQYSENQEILAKAWFYGYTVKQPKLYTVEIPNPNETHLIVVLRKWEGCVLIDRFGVSYDWKKDSIFHLTEQEIKQDFEWAWQEGFAKEVEND
ncbi:DUF1642 domain-containing protein [Streptococcus pluranimalium]|uniref:DUF1642 domain-containing protein n=1 Tax=Streptococcus pluranimalium TaxID=82348 RepID=UPI003F673A93